MEGDEIVLVHDKRNPEKKPWKMSAKGFRRLEIDFPGKYAIFQQIETKKKVEPHVIHVEKINKPIPQKEEKPREPNPKKVKRGKPKA